jgi:hypothetical protein
MKKAIFLFTFLFTIQGHSQCSYSIELLNFYANDSIEVEINGVVTTYSVPTGSNTIIENFSVNNLDNLKVELPTSFIGVGQSYILRDSENLILDQQVLGENFNEFTTSVNCPTCFIVSQITSLDQGNGDFQISWVENNGSTQWEIAAVPLGQDLSSFTGSTLITYTNPSTLNGLGNDTLYEVYVRSLCTASDSSKWVKGASILTVGAPQIVNLNSTAFQNMLISGNGVKLKGYLGNQSADLNNDNLIQVQEARLVVELFFNNVVDFTGIGAFNNLESLRISAFGISRPSTPINIDLSSLIHLKVFSSSDFKYASLNLSNVMNLEALTLFDSEINSLTLNSDSSLKIFQISDTNLLAIDLSSKISLEILTLNDQPNLASLILPNSNLLESIRIDDTPNLNVLDLSFLSSLKIIDIFRTGINGIDVSNCVDLEQIGLRELTGVSSFDATLYPNLESLYLSNSDITSINLLSNPLLETLAISDTDIDNVDFTNSVNLELFQAFGTQIELLDFSNCPNLNLIDIQRSNRLGRDTLVKTIILKNGVDNSLASTPSFNMATSSNNLIEYICTDSSDLDYIRNNSWNVANVVFNSYCFFTPGGNFNEIEGSISMDIDNNGCDPTDPVLSNFNFIATDGTTTGTISSNQSGTYYAPVADGQHTITPNPENPTYWNFSPPNLVLDFPTQTSPFTQDFCVTANGMIEDLEVIVVPLEQARPGFDTDYKVVVKNKGNQTSSGSVTLDFEEDFMTLLSSNPNAGNNPSNQLSWSFSNLQPFQMSPYEFTMRLNTPTATVNPLNSNDILTFTGTVTGTGTDAMPADNVMVLDQTVVNSYDPNDKTCLEGATITPALVGEYVHYMIRFENTGTASAINVVIKDEIDLAQFDITTLIPLGGSHDYYTRVRDNNVVEFIHENINLDFNDATNDGYVLFKIKTLNTLIEGDTFDNTAEIYFDFNFPIITNTETVTVMSTASIGETTDTSIAVYPNPARGFINISSLNGLKSATLIDVNGRRLSQTNFIGNTTEQRISLENLTSGVYFVTIQSDLGQKVEKVIVE